MTLIPLESALIFDLFINLYNKFLDSSLVTEIISGLLSFFSLTSNFTLWPADLYDFKSEVAILLAPPPKSSAFIKRILIEYYYMMWCDN
jgi:hypothetical protein